MARQLQNFIQFWIYHPGLFYGIAFTLGCSFALTSQFWMIIPCFFLWLPFFLKADKEEFKLLGLSLLIFLTGWAYSSAHYSFPKIPSSGLEGTGYVKLKSIKLQPSLFGKQWIYRCELEQFFPIHSFQSIAKGLPCLIILPKSFLYNRPLANQDYLVKGNLIQKTNGSYQLKISTKNPWTPMPGTWSWAEKRFLWKQKVSEWIKLRYKHPQSASFLAGLATGEFDDLWMRQNFARFGLLHLLAISGFHFAIVAAFLSLILRFFLPFRIRTLLLFIILGAYCFFLGPQASILRAWLMCIIALCGGLLDKQSTALNSLGIALILILGYEPIFCLEMGFQLSFATTAAILIFYAPAQSFFKDLFPHRNLSEALQMDRISQHAYIVLAFLRQGLALTLAVNFLALPLTLFYFQQFPWMSLLYNLFFPFLATGSLCFFLLGTLLSFFPLLPNFIHEFNSQYTFFLLQLTHQIPSEMDAYLTLKTFPAVLLVVYLCTIFLGGILWKQHQLQKKNEIFS